jgi:hypothetical protein
VTFANTIPGTVTGNSDQADYKDAVLAPFAPVTNCGSITVKKVTSPAGLAGTFTYTIAAGGANIFNTGGVDADCSVSGSSDLTQCKGTLVTPGTTDTDTIANLRENDTSYTLTEVDPSPDFSLSSIVCVQNGTTYTLYGVANPDPGFKVVAGQTTACTITNTLVKKTPNQSTSQVGYAQVKDTINLTDIKAGASDASSATASFALYSDNACSGTPVGTAGPISLTYANSGTTASATMTTVISITPGVTYYWKVTYSGDAFNNPVTTACQQESVTANFTFVGQ